MIIAGVDPATKNVGIGVLELTEGGLKVLDVRPIAAKHDNLHERFIHIYSETSSVFQKYKPDVVAIESQYLAVNPHAFRVISYSVGIVWASAITFSDAQVEILEAKRWRKLAFGNGNASKKDCIHNVKEMFDLSKFSGLREDDYEALGIAVAMANLVREGG